MVLVFNGMVAADDERIRLGLKQLELSVETHCSVASYVQLLTVKLTYVWVAALHFSPACFCCEL